METKNLTIEDLVKLKNVKKSVKLEVMWSSEAILDIEDFFFSDIDRLEKGSCRAYNSPLCL